MDKEIILKKYGRIYRLYPTKDQIKIFQDWQNGARAYGNEILWNQTVSERFFDEKKRDIVELKIKALTDVGKTEEEIKVLKDKDFWVTINNQLSDQYPIKDAIRNGFKEIRTELTIDKKGPDRELLDKIILERYPNYVDLKDSSKSYLGACGEGGMYKVGTGKYKLPSALVIGILKSNDKAWTTFYEICKNGKSVQHLVGAKKKKAAKGKRVDNFGKPKFMKKWEIPNLLFSTGNLKGPNFEKQQVFIQTLKTPIKAKLDVYPIGIITSYTVSNIGKKWFISYGLKTNVIEPEHQHIESQVGLDLGVTKFLTTTDSSQKTRIFELDKTSKKRLAILKNRVKMIQTIISRLERAEPMNYIEINWKLKMSDKTNPDYKHFQRHSNNWFRSNQKLVETKYKINEILKNFRHHVSNVITDKYGTIGIDNLQISNMTKSGKGTKDEHGKNVKQKAGLNRSILEQGWGIFNNQLKYKASWRGAKVIEIDPKYTSQTCPDCGHVSRDNRKTQAKFECIDCGHSANADVVGSQNNLKKINKKVAIPETL